jgi:hypothetical protein
MKKELYIPFTKVRIGRFLFLLLSILLIFVIRPFLEDFIKINVLMDIFFTVILLSGIYAASQKKNFLIIALAIAFPTLIAHWSAYFLKIPYSFLVGSILGSIFFAYITIIILFYLFREKEITSDIIIGSICAYFLIGLMWAYVFSAMEIVKPGSFQIPQQLNIGMHHFTYYSFVTITTLGYGDITPISHPAQSLSFLEAITGQLYIAVLIARLVGIHISQSMNK